MNEIKEHNNQNVSIPEKLTDIFTFENLLKAFNKAAKSKRQKADVHKFKKDLFKNLMNIVRLFKRGKYPDIEYYSFIIEKPKRRIVWATTFEMRVIQHCFCDEFLTPFFEQYYVDRNCACRKGKGVDYASNILKTDLKSYYNQNNTNSGWVIKADIESYFASINHDVLKEMLNPLIPDGEVKDFLFYIINSFEHGGLPLGNQTSQLLALFYLSPIDELLMYKYANIRKTNTYYVRYVDDFIFIGQYKDMLVAIRDDIENVVTSKLLLKLNRKTSIHPIKNGVNFLGWKYSLLDTGKIVKRRMKSKKNDTKALMKETVFLYKNKYINAKSYNNRVTSMLSTLDKGNAYEFKTTLIRLQF